MNRAHLMLTLLSAAALTVGCHQEGPTSQPLEPVEAKAQDPAQELKDYPYAQKTQFIEQAQDQLIAMDRKIDELSARIETSSDAVKTEAKPKLQVLRGQTARLNLQLDQVKRATESTWDSAKDGCKKAYACSKDAFQQAQQWASAKLAP
jgi:outer membrane biogenesis lipoprotein LolB